MTIEVANAQQGAPASTPAPEPAAEILPADTTGTPQPQTGTEGNKPTDTTEKPQPKKSPWFMGEITGLRADRRKLESENEALKRQLAEGNTSSQPTAQSLVPASEVDTLATQKAAEWEFNKKCNQVTAEGSAEFPDFADAIGNLGSIGLIGDDRKAKEFLQLATEMDNSHKILHYLGTNPEEAVRIKALSPTKQAVELARMESKLRQPQPANNVSKAPEPIKPLDGKSGGKSAYGTAYYEGMSGEEYRAWRNNRKKGG